MTKRAMDVVVIVDGETVIQDSFVSLAVGGLNTEKDVFTSLSGEKLGVSIITGRLFHLSQVLLDKDQVDVVNRPVEEPSGGLS